jgi:hypothetical protein
MMAGNGGDAHQDKARRFRDATLPHLNDAYTLADVNAEELQEFVEKFEAAFHSASRT